MSTPFTAQFEHTPLIIASHVVSRIIQGRALILDPERDEIQQLNDVGSFLWSLLIQGNSSQHYLVQALLDEFEVDSEMAQIDVQDFLQELLTRGFLLDPCLSSDLESE